jgi:hypothetical protein
MVVISQQNMAWNGGSYTQQLLRIYRYRYVLLRPTALVHQIIMAQRHPRGNPQKSYHIPPLKHFYYDTGRELPKILYYPNTATSFIVSHSCDTQILILIRTLSPLCCTPLEVSDCIHPLSAVCVYVSPPSSDIKIINNQINTQHVKTKTNVIKSTIIYIKPINTYNLQLHTLQ